ncbi:MAG: succinate--CoA ligase subunit alpha [Acidobacteriota bacterium]
MSIWVDENTRLLVQGITGREGSFHARQCREYGTQVVAGVTPGKGGLNHEGVPVYNTVSEAVERELANAALIFVPPPFAADAVMEAVDAEIELIVCITEGVPVLDMLKVDAYMRGKKSRLIGPNCPGIITPGKCKIGIMPGAIHKEGRVGCISRSGTLTYEAVGQLTSRNIGQSTCVGIGGDPITGTGFIDVLEAFDADSDTEAVVMIGEIGGSAEEEAADYIMKEFSKPVIGFIAGQTAPPGRRMGHAGAIISQGRGTAAEKMEKMRECGIRVVQSPAEIGAAVEKALEEQHARSDAGDR